MEAYSLVIMLGGIVVVIAWSVIDNIHNDREGLKKRRAEQIAADRESARAVRDIRHTGR